MSTTATPTIASINLEAPGPVQAELRRLEEHRRGLDERRARLLAERDRARADGDVARHRELRDELTDIDDTIEVLDGGGLDRMRALARHERQLRSSEHRRRRAVVSAAITTAIEAKVNEIVLLVADANAMRARVAADGEHDVEAFRELDRLTGWIARHFPGHLADARRVLDGCDDVDEILAAAAGGEAWLADPDNAD